MGNFGFFGTTIAFFLLIIFLAIGVVAFFAAFISRCSRLVTTNVDAIASSIEAAAEKLQTRSRGFALIAGWWLKGKRRNVYLAAVHFRHRRLERTWSPTLKRDQIKLQADVRGGNNLFVSQTEVIRGGQQTIVKRVVKC